MKSKNTIKISNHHTLHVIQFLKISQLTILWNRH